MLEAKPTGLEQSDEREYKKPAYVSSITTVSMKLKLKTSSYLLLKELEAVKKTFPHGSWKVIVIWVAFLYQNHSAPFLS